MEEVGGPACPTQLATQPFSFGPNQDKKSLIYILLKSGLGGEWPAAT